MPPYWFRTYTVHGGYRLELEVCYDELLCIQIFTGAYRYVPAWQ